MSITYTSLLGLAQPTPGTESGTWGTTINDSVTALIETAIAGSKTADVTSSNWTLTDIDGADDTARAAVLIPTGTNGATTRSILAPNQSKIYVVINQASGSVVIKGVTGPTTGVTVTAGSQAIVAWNGSDFVNLTPISSGGTVTSVAATVPSFLSVSGSPITSSGTLAINLSGTALPVANGGTGVTTSTGSGNVVLSTSPTFPAQTNFTANSAYNIYASGTGTNLFTGAVQIGSTAFNGATLSLTRNITGGGGSYGYAIRSTGQIQSDVTTQVNMYDTYPSTVAATFTLASLGYFRAAQGTIGAGSTVTNQYGFYVDSSLTGATNNYGFYGNIASGTNRYNLYMAGTAPNAFSGDVNIFGTGKLGYTTGSGGQVTQTPTRVSAVILNTTNGSVTLASAAGSTTYQSFNIVNSTVVSTDTVIINQKSGTTDIYEVFVSSVATGNFRITFRTTGGTTTEQPVFNFAVIKASNA